MKNRDEDIFAIIKKKRKKKTTPPTHLYTQIRMHAHKHKLWGNIIEAEIWSGKQLHNITKIWADLKNSKVNDAYIIVLPKYRSDKILVIAAYCCRNYDSFVA